MIDCTLRQTHSASLLLVIIMFLLRRWLQLVSQGWRREPDSGSESSVGDVDRNFPITSRRVRTKNMRH